MLNEFKNLNIREVNPVKEITNKLQSASTGFMRILDLASKDLKNKFEPFIIFEDDIKTFRTFPDSIDVPNDADMLYIGVSQNGQKPEGKHFGYNNVQYKDVNDDIVKVYNMLSMHGLMICSIRGMLTIQKAMMEAYYSNKICDRYVAQLQPYINAYALKYPLVYQWKDLGGKEYETKVNHESFNKKGHNKVPSANDINKTNVSVITFC
tara:strand:- start:2540 stop:3163 length:624 start_codon:yes stop_codon:yes gene_type:complete